ncbi:unnamed protein product [Rotaria sp. Silwood1]|nr:unnamed protein product [Rotaria sp. Silwood1]CAF1482032.1 unnamed protein product [Rotaria sp. Silwood1]CAF1492928.1 unnamed protein product [Rotaria sp. Silwood1]CAF3409690.1 unnamed protein product [Rotaria sp. Silwood1]CAF3592105.1 unnamed protein product [Rotaria sp. Silwood1]
MIDRVEQLESLNAKYVAKLADLRGLSFTVGTIGKQNDEHYRLQSDIMAVNFDKVGYESEIELFQLQIKIYQQMIQAENQSIDEQRLKLERELNQSASALVNLRTSYAELGQQVGTYRATCQDMLQQYLRLAKDWSISKKQINELKIRVQMTKNQIKFSKILRSYVLSKNDVFSMDMSDFSEFWKHEWEQIIKKIRHDFELLYGAMHQETINFYEMKTKELQIELEQITQYQPVENEKHVKFQQKLQSEYEEVQKKFASEKQVLMELEATYSKLESELQTIQMQHEERFEAQSNDLHYLQESIMAMVSSVEEMQRRRVDSKVVLQYTLPNGLRLQPGSELNVYSESGAAVAQKSRAQSAFPSSLHQELVLKDISSMGR